MFDIFISLFLSAIISIGVKLYCDDSGLGAFPFLIFLIVAVLSYAATAFAHGILSYFFQ